MNTQAKVALDKQKHSERYCPEPRCLWKTTKLNHATQQHEGGGYCPRHKRTEQLVELPTLTVMEWIRNGFQFSGNEHA